MSSEEASLLKRARLFEAEALSEIYDRYSSELYRYAWRLLGKEDLAEECVAEAFSSFLNVIKQGGGPKRHLRAYLYRIVHNIAVDYYRRKPPPEISIEEVQLPDLEMEPSETIARLSEVANVRLALSELTFEQRQVILLKYIEGWSNTEVAKTMEKPVGAVKSLHHRAIRNLRRSLLSERSEKDVRKK